MDERNLTGDVERPDQRASIARLWANAAHDLRQPVQAALLVARTLEAESSHAEQRLAAQCVAGTLESLCEMLDVLVLMSRIEGGLQGVPLRICTLSEVLEPVLRGIADIAKQRGIPLGLGRMQGLVRSNPRLLALAVKSLLLHAIKFRTSEKIVTRSRRRGAQMRFEVEFNGVALGGAGGSNAFIQLAALSEGTVAQELGLGIALLERLCQRLGHGLYHAKLPSGSQLFAIDLPVAPASEKPAVK